MRKKQTPEGEDQRNERFAKEAQKRFDDAAADKAIDAMVKRSLKRYGPLPASTSNVRFQPKALPATNDASVR